MELDNTVKVFVICICLLRAICSLSQPTISSKTKVLDQIIYRDAKDNSQFYFAQGDIALVRDENGKPELKYLRLSGAKVKNNEPTLITSNILQFKVTRLDLSSSKIQQLKNVLEKKFGPVKISHIPLKKMEFFLVKGRESVNRPKSLSTSLNASFQNEMDYKIWKDKWVTIHLSNEATQLINQHLAENNNLGITLHYNYLADFDDCRNSTQIDGTDSLDVQTYSFKKGMVNLDFDLGIWRGDCINDLVLNEEILPRYHPIVVQNFDYSNNYRPDLLATKIIICGNGFDGKLRCAKELEFHKGSPTNFNTSFRFPILLDQPLQYKITEITKEGLVKSTEWTHVALGQAIDITTNLNQIEFGHQIIEFQVDQEEMQNVGYKSAEVELIYQLNNRKNSKKIILEAKGQSDFVQTELLMDKSSSFHYSVNWVKEDDRLVKGDNSQDVLEIGYLYLKPVLQ